MRQPPSAAAAKRKGTGVTWRDFHEIWGQDRPLRSLCCRWVPSEPGVGAVYDAMARVILMLCGSWWQKTTAASARCSPAG